MQAKGRRVQAKGPRVQGGGIQRDAERALPRLHVGLQLPWWANLEGIAEEQDACDDTGPCLGQCLHLPEAVRFVLLRGSGLPQN